MLGAIAGDIIGSRWEFGGQKTKEFPLFTGGCKATDDSVMTIAVAEALLECRDRTNLSAQFISSLRYWGKNYPDAGYGARFFEWLYGTDMYPIYSFGNGSAMRVSPCAWAAETLEEVLELAKTSAEVSHNAPDGIAGAQAIAAAVFMARKGADKQEIKQYTEAHFYPLDFTIDAIRPKYDARVKCSESVPQAIEAFLEADSYEDVVRTAISLGGDSDTQACMAGAIAEAYYGVPEDIREKALTYLDRRQRDVLLRFEGRFGRDKG